MSIGTMVQNALAHLRVVDENGHGLVGPDAQEGVDHRARRLGAASARYGRAFQGSAKPMTSPPVTSRNPRRVKRHHEALLVPT